MKKTTYFYKLYGTGAIGYFEEFCDELAKQKVLSLANDTEDFVLYEVNLTRTSKIPIIGRIFGDLIVKAK